LHVAQRHPGVEGGGDERMPERVRADALADPGVAGEATDDASGAAAVQPPPGRGEEDRPLGPLADGEVDRPGGARRERDSDDLAALAQHGEGAMPPFGAERFDVGAERLRDAQPVQREQRHQGVLGRGTEPGGNQDGAELVAVQGGGMRLVVHPGPADMRGGRVAEQPLLDRVPVEAGHGRKPPGDRAARPAAVLELAGVALDVGSPDLEQAHVALGAPGGEQAQVHGVGVASLAAVAGQEADKREPLRVGERSVEDDDLSRWGIGVRHEHLRVRPGPGGQGTRGPSKWTTRTVRSKNGTRSTGSTGRPWCR